MVTFTDDFTAANGDLHDGRTGVGWSFVDGGGNGFEVLNNQVSPQGTTRGITNASRITTPTDTLDQVSEVSVATLATADCEAGPSVRMSDLDDTYYFARYQRQAATYSVEIWKCISGTFSLVSSSQVVVGTPPDTIRLEIEGNTLRAYFNGNLTNEVTDPTVPANPYVGIYGHEPPGQGLGVSLDSFTGGDLGGAPTEITGSFAGSLPMLTSSSNGSGQVDGSLAGTLPLLAADLSGEQSVSGSLTGALPLLTASFGTSAEISGSLAASFPIPSLAGSGDVVVDGSFAAGLPLPQAQANGLLSAVGSVAGTMPQLQSAMVGELHATGVLAGALPLLVADIIDESVPKTADTIFRMATERTRVQLSTDRTEYSLVDSRTTWEKR